MAATSTPCTSGPHETKEMAFLQTHQAMPDNPLPVQSQFIINQSQDRPKELFLDVFHSHSQTPVVEQDLNRYRRASISFPTEPTYNQNRQFSSNSENDYLQALQANTRKGSISKPGATKIYALRIASKPGIYHSWTLAKTLIDGCPGAKYKGFFTLEECMKFFWEQFPNATFVPDESGDFIMENPEPVYRIIEEARQKKEKNSGMAAKDDASSVSPADPQFNHLKNIINSDKNLRIPLNEQQTKVLRAVQANSNVFITGGSKTGKNVLLSHIIKQMVDAKKTFHVTSVSVLTALDEKINFTVGWTGMGKALGTKKHMLMKVRKNTQARKAWTDVSTLIIKDCSLLSAFLLDIMDFLGKEIRKDSRPFGGIQIILCGDSRGLSPPNVPAVSCPNCGQSHKLAQQSIPTALNVGGYINCSNELCNNVFVNTWILFPFESVIWETAQFIYFKLTKRYSSETELFELIDAIVNDPSTEKLKKLQVTKQDQSDSDIPVVCPTQDDATTINDTRIQQIPGEFVKYEAFDTVLNNFDFTSRAQQKDGPTDEAVNLKKGAKVLYIKDGERAMQEGVVVDFVTPTDAFLARAVTKFGCGFKQIEKSIKDWNSKNPLLPKIRLLETNEELIVTSRAFVVHSCRRAVAWRVQIPLLLGYAFTLHKSHKMKMNRFMISSEFKWNPGELIAALAMARSINSIFISGEIPRFESDSRVVEFEKTSLDGQISPPVNMNQIPEGLIPPSNISSKRPSISTITGPYSKKRRSSKASLGFNDDVITTLPTAPNDAQFLRYQQNLSSTRRHSYQPLTSYQEQQFAWIQQQSHGITTSPINQGELMMNLPPNMNINMHGGYQSGNQGDLNHEIGLLSNTSENNLQNIVKGDQSLSRQFIYPQNQYATIPEDQARLSRLHNQGSNQTVQLQFAPIPGGLGENTTYTPLLNNQQSNYQSQQQNWDHWNNNN